MSKKDEAMNLALEALAVKFSEGWHEGIKIDASDIMLLNDAAQALAEQPAQQEPVVFYRCNGCGHAYEQVHPTSCDCMEDGGFDRVEYYTSPPAQRTWVGLTDEEWQDLSDRYGLIIWGPFKREIEAKLREKNT